MVKEKIITIISMHYQKQHDHKKTQNVCSKVKSNTTRKIMQQYLQYNLESNKVKEKNVITCVAQH